jgi:ABC-type branched-subunit amino acid transport system ATPase component
VLPAKVSAFIVSAAIAGFGGGLFAFGQSYINPDSFRVFDSIQALLAVLLGGSGTSMGPILGSMILVLLPEGLHPLGSIRLVTYGVLTLACLWLFPRGVLSGLSGRMWTPNRDGNQQTRRDVAVWVPSKEGVGVSIRDVSHSFGGIRALSGVSLEVKPGRIHGLVGPNGAGKSTLINAISGFVKGYRGEIFLGEEPLGRRTPEQRARQGIARTFQRVRIVSQMTVLEHVLLPVAVESCRTWWHCPWSGLLASPTPGEVAAARGALALCGLLPLEQEYGDALPHGHQRMLDLARAIAARPQVLLLDEPSAGLEAAEVQGLTEILARLRDAGMTVLLVDHNMDFLFGMADDVTLLDRGLLVQSDRASTVSTGNILAAYWGDVSVSRS